MNFYTLASKLNKKIDSDIRSMRPLGREDACGISQKDAEAFAERRALAEFDRNTRLGIKLMMRFKEIAAEEGLYSDKIKQMYFITIRPNPTDVTFTDFYNKVKDFTERRCFKSFELAFEQKGISAETLGEGFHCHILAHMNQRSKGEVLRDVQSTFKHMASANCIQVDCLKTLEDVDRTRAYITEHKSEDGHKEITKEWDAQWRNRINLAATYTSHLPTIKSELAGCSVSNTQLQIDFV